MGRDEESVGRGGRQIVYLAQCYLQPAQGRVQAAFRHRPRRCATVLESAQYARHLEVVVGFRRESRLVFGPDEMDERCRPLQIGVGVLQRVSLRLLGVKRKKERLGLIHRATHHYIDSYIWLYIHIHIYTYKYIYYISIYYIKTLVAV